MKTDTYIKTILTIIAACLILIVIKLYPVNQANAGKREVIKVNIAEIGGHGVFRAIPVKIESK